MAAVCDAVRQVMRCDVCGDEVPIPLGSLKWVSAVMLAFADAHPDEMHAGRRTWVSVCSEEPDDYHDCVERAGLLIDIDVLKMLVRDCLELAVERGQPDCAFTDRAERYVELRARAEVFGVFNKRKG